MDTCPHCGMPFYAVKCPRCGYTARATHFVEGCPSCGYLAESQIKSSPGEAGRRDSSKRRSGSTAAGPQQKKESGGLPSWAFFLILLILGTLFAGLAAVYLNI